MGGIQSIHWIQSVRLKDKRTDDSVVVCAPSALCLYKQLRSEWNRKEDKSGGEVDYIGMMESVVGLWSVIDSLPCNQKRIKNRKTKNPLPGAQQERGILKINQILR